LLGRLFAKIVEILTVLVAYIIVKTAMVAIVATRWRNKSAPKSGYPDIFSLCMKERACVLAFCLPD
jgi:hypothetical protein